MAEKGVSVDDLNDSESERPSRKHENAYGIDTLCSIYVHSVLWISFLGSVLLFNVSLLSHWKDNWEEEELGSSVNLGYWYLGYSILALIALFALHRIMGTNERFHESRLKK